LVLISKLEFKIDIKSYKIAECSKRRLPEIAIVSDNYLMFRCTDGCDQNVSIQFVCMEDIGDGEGVLTFNLACPKCKNSYHYKIYLGSYDKHTFYGVGWNEQIKQWQKQKD